MGTQPVITNWAIDPVHTKIRFDAKYLLVTSVSGWFREFEGMVTSTGDDFNNCSIQLIIYTHSLDTGNQERDAHLRSADFFDTALYPSIRFTATEARATDTDIYIKGTLQVKDVTQPIEFTARHQGIYPDPMGNTKAAFEMDAVLNRKNFNISWNQSFDKQGILLADEVKLHADIQLLRLS